MRFDWRGGKRAEQARRSGGRTLHVEGLEDRRVLAGVITIGDSWAFLVAAGAPSVYAPAPPGGTINSLGNVMATYQPGVPVYNESFGGGTAAQMVTELHTPTGIIARINAHPDADVVWLSAGGNDLLLGQLGGGFWVGNPNNANVYAAVQANVQTIVNAILAVRPDIQVVVMGYDYVNVWDMVSGSAGDTLRFNLGIGKTGIPGVDAIQNESLNNGMKDAEAGKIAIANASRRVAHVNNFGLLNTLVGYNGYFGNFGPANPPAYPPELYPYLPTPPSRMANGDAIHLNNAGYTALALHAELDFLLSAFSSPGLTLSTTTLAFGDRRIGTSSQLDVTASNNGANFSKVQNLQFQTASGAFSGGGQSFNPLFKDPTLGSDTANVSYAFAPTSHAVSNQSITVSSNSGSPSVSLSGRGVGPEYSGPSTVVVPGFPLFGQDTIQEFNIGNATLDGDLGSLTDLTLLSASISGPAAARFSLANFTPGTVVGAGENVELEVEFDWIGASPGNYSATLTFTTDQNAAFGATGQQFSITLTADVPIVETFTVTGRRIFYNNSIWDNPTFGFNNASAIAPDKSAYIPSGFPTGTVTVGVQNVTNYSKGINGIMVEITAGPSTATAADFEVKMSGQNLGADNAPSGWAAAPAFTVTVVPNTPSTGTTRYELVWPDGAIVDRYVSVTTKANANTGLFAPDTFYFGNRVGDAFTNYPGFFNTDATDAIEARANQNPFVGITNPYDFDRDAVVNASDELIARGDQNFMAALVLSNPPAAPQAADDSGSAVASALAGAGGGNPEPTQGGSVLLPARSEGAVSAGGFWHELGQVADPLAEELLGAFSLVAESFDLDEPPDDALGEPLV
jgi:hypothetical protein